MTQRPLSSGVRASPEDVPETILVLGMRTPVRVCNADGVGPNEEDVATPALGDEDLHEKEIL